MRDDYVNKQLRLRQIQTEKMALTSFICLAFGNFMYNLLIQRRLLESRLLQKK